MTWDEEDYGKTIVGLIGRVRRVGKNGQEAFAKINKMLRMNLSVGEFW